jgi:hypothetical protein
VVWAVGFLVENPWRDYLRYPYIEPQVGFDLVVLVGGGSFLSYEVYGI